MVEKTSPENNPNAKLSQEDAAKQAEQLAKELKKLKAQLKKTTPAKEEKPAPKAKEKKKTTPAKEEKPAPKAKEKKKTTPAKEEKPAPKAKEKKKTTPAKEEKPAPKAKEKKKTTPAKEEKPAPKAKEKKKTTPAKEEKPAPKAKEKKTFEEELEEQLTDEEIENFQIAKVDMDKLTNKVTEILAKYESKGMLQSELWKKLKLTSRDGSRLALKLERMGIISREKILENGRWTYKLIIKKTPISTTSIENAPCLTCPVEQKCTIDGEISPRTCKWIEDWVLVQISSSKKQK